MPRKSFKDAAEAFALVSASSFLISSAIHQSVFWFWGVNFLSIATIEDVALGGIRLLLTCLATCAMLFVVQVVTVFLFSAQIGRSSGLASFVRYGLLVGLLTSWITFNVLTREWLESLAPLEWAKFLLYSNVAVGLAGSLLFILTSKRTLTQDLSAMYPRGVLSSFLFLAVLMGSITSVVRLAGRDMPLRVAGQVPIKQCGRDAKIRWVGSRAIVLDCARGRFIWFYGQSPPALQVMK